MNAHAFFSDLLNFLSWQSPVAPNPNLEVRCRKHPHSSGHPLLIFKIKSNILILFYWTITWTFLRQPVLDFVLCVSHSVPPLLIFPFTPWSTVAQELSYYLEQESFWPLRHKTASHPHWWLTRPAGMVWVILRSTQRYFCYRCNHAEIRSCLSWVANEICSCYPDLGQDLQQGPQPASGSSFLQLLFHPGKARHPPSPSLCHGSHWPACAWTANTAARGLMCIRDLILQ